MSEYIKIICDACNQPIIDRPCNSIGITPSKALNKITLTRAASTNNDKIKAGTYHFCDEDCLLDFVEK